jgi:hypothetical protein
MIPPPHFFSYYGFWVELTYSLMVVISSLIIFMKTRELYELSSHRGIKYFRNTFLFFGITYFIRFILRLSMALHLDFFRPPMFGLIDIAFFITAYASTMAFVYLIYSLFWKKIDKYLKNHLYIFHIIALAIAFISVIIRIPEIVIILQSILFILLIIVGSINYQKNRNKKFSKMYLVYLLIFALWIIGNVAEFIINLSLPIGLLIYAASVILFLSVLVKVIKELLK